MSFDTGTGKFLWNLWQPMIDARLRSQAIWSKFIEEHQAQQHRELMKDPAYAAWYEEHEAADQTEVFWLTLYDNWFLEENTDDED